MKKIIIVFIFIMFPACKDKMKPNTVDFKQINQDGSNNDRYIFREDIKREKWRKNRYKKDKF